MTFDQLGLSAPLVQAVAAEGYTTPTPIQAQAIPSALQGKDILGCAQTGTGKTAAFALPTLQRLAAKRASPVNGRTPIRCLVVTPTRELASQVADSFTAYGRNLGLRNTVIFGGVGQNAQVQELRRGVDILVATPGRLLDLMNQRLVSLQQVEILVLDEADRMLDMGFIRDVKKIIAAVPKQRQTLFFSATMPAEIQSLVSSILVNPVRVEVTPVATTAEKVEQSVYLVEKGDKKSLLLHLLQDATIERALVFTRTKSGANRLTKILEGARIRSEAIHGNKSQNARERALENFKSGESRILVATDIAARGIDVDGVSHVINFDLPNIPETYVHRIGRTARAGRSGKALSLCDFEERAYLRDIERTTRQAIPVVAEHPFKSTATRAPAGEPQQRGHGGGGQRREGGGPRGDGGGQRRGSGGGRNARRGGGGGGGRPGGARAHGSGGSSSGGQSSSAPAGSSSGGRRDGRSPMPKWF